jgi:hypothetical protein
MFDAIQIQKDPGEYLMIGEIQACTAAPTTSPTVSPTTASPTYSPTGSPTMATPTLPVPTYGWILDSAHIVGTVLTAAYGGYDGVLNGNPSLADPTALSFDGVDDHISVQ